MKTVKIVLSTICLAIIFTGCDFRKKSVTREDTPTSGAATFIADDCLANIVGELVDVFVAQNVMAELTPIYLDEKEAIDLLLSDSIRLAILARDLTKAEKDYIRSVNNKLVPRTQKIATDGIALILHKDNPDTLISVQTLQKVMSRELATWKQLNKASKLDTIRVVFENSTSSTVRFIQDSICGDKQLSAQHFAMNSNQEVLDYVIKNPNAMGVIGVNWVSSPQNPIQPFIDEVKVMGVSRNHPATIANAVQPYPAYLYLRDYPLTRDIYVILTDLRGTLPAGFTHFVASDNGQRIILKSGLVPATKPIRTIQYREE